MRKIAFDMKAAQFNRMPTPPTITFREPLMLDGSYVRCIVYGEDVNLRELLIEVVALEDDEEAQQFRDMEDTQWESVLVTYESLGSKYP